MAKKRARQESAASSDSQASRPTKQPRRYVRGRRGSLQELPRMPLDVIYTASYQLTSGLN